MIVTVSDENGIKQYNVSEHIKVILLVLVFLILLVIGSLSFYVKSLNDKLNLLEDRIKLERIVEKSNDAEVMYLAQDKNVSMNHTISSQSDLALIEALKIKKESEKLRIIALNKAKDEKLKQEQLVRERAERVEAERKKALKLTKEREEHLKKETARQLVKLSKEKAEHERLLKLLKLQKLQKAEEKKHKERLAREKKKKMLKFEAIKKAKLARLKKEKELKRKKEKLARQRKLAKINKVDKEKKVTNRIDSLPSIAKSKLGKRYVWGAVGPSVFDCSGFTSYIYKKKGISIPRTSRQQSKYGKLVDRKHLKPGDLIFFDTSHRRTGVINHVGMYIGNNQFIHASSAKKRVVITKLSNFYSKRFKWARRVIN